MQFESSGMRSAWLLAAATTLVVTSFSMFSPLLAVQLQQRGYSPTAIGAFAMIPFACVALLIPWMPRAFGRFGLGRCYVAGLLLESLCTVGYLATESFVLWCASAVAGGVGAAAVWNGTEALLAQRAPAHQRGRIMGLYQTALGGALAVGPFLPAALQWPTATTLWVATGVQFAALGLALATGVARHSARGTQMHETAPTLGTWQAVRQVPALIGIAFAGGVFEAGLGSISAANGASLGLTMGAAASIVGALGLGSFLWQYPAGLAADRWALARVFGFAGALLLLSALAFAFTQGAQHLWLLWACAWLWGGVGGALYTLSMISVAHHFSTQAVAAGTAAMITGYTLGGAAGPVISGAALQYAGTLGLTVWLGGLAVGVMALARRV
jgi:MFS family permease